MSQYICKRRLFQNKILIIGFGSIAQAILPLIFQHLNLSPKQITIISKKNLNPSIANEYGVIFKELTITEENYQTILQNNLSEGDFLLNLSVDISSFDLIKWCQIHQVLYLDTSIELWPPKLETAFSLSRSCYALREKLLEFKKACENKKKLPTTIVAHGANPGLVSHFVKEALINIANENKINDIPKNKTEWAQLAKDLSIKVIHIAENDTQISNQAKKPNEFVNTWSIDSFIIEGTQFAELGWGTHELHWPHDAQEHYYGRKSAIYLKKPGIATCIKTWSSLSNEFRGLLITHFESISIADYLTVKNKDELIYRPTVHYVYQPCADAILSFEELIKNRSQQKTTHRILNGDIIQGVDELGVLLMGNNKGAYWFGSILSIHDARALVPHNSATTLQVAIGALAGMLWAIENPQAGLLEADEIDYRFIMEIARPYLGKVIGCFTNWTPLQNLNESLPQKIDYSDPWQFLNLRVR